MNIRGIVQRIVDDSGQDLVEYALLTGMVSLGSVLFVIVARGIMTVEWASWQIPTGAPQRLFDGCEPGAC